MLGSLQLGQWYQYLHYNQYISTKILEKLRNHDRIHHRYIDSYHYDIQIEGKESGCSPPR